MTVEFKSWSNLNDKDRDFFIGEDYLPLHGNIIDRISLAKGINAINYAEELLKGSFAYKKLMMGSTPPNQCVCIENGWDRDVGTGEIRDWLYKLGIAFSEEIFLIYNSVVVKTDWKVFIKYWDAFSWSVGVSLKVVGSSKLWLLEVHHEDYMNFYKS